LTCSKNASAPLVTGIDVEVGSIMDGPFMKVGGKSA
jgi:hypothetical protein